MPFVIGIDLGTSKIVGLAVDALTGDVAARAFRQNGAEVTSAEGRARGRSEWNARQIVDRGLECLAELAGLLAGRSRDVLGIGVTGQQHGVVLIDRGEPQTPLINWQDRRANEQEPGTGRTYLESARARLDTLAAQRCGCRLQPGFAATTLYWLTQQGLLPRTGLACCIMDYFAALLTQSEPRCEPTSAGSTGVFNVAQRTWDEASIRALGLPRELFPPIVEANQALGRLCAQAGSATGLATGTPVYPAVGDHQASYLGCIADRECDVLVNVGTGAQVAVFTPDLGFDPPVELRPFPVAGNLQSYVGLAGGWSYRLFESFVRAVVTDVFGRAPQEHTYEALNRLAASVPAGALGLRCDPAFAGTRANPDARGAFYGITPQNFKPAHFARALLEGMARAMAEGYQTLRAPQNRRRHQRLVAAGNGLRENALLAELVARELAMPMAFTVHREEAAFGAAILAAWGAGLHADLAAAARAMIRYE